MISLRHDEEGKDAATKVLRQFLRYGLFGILCSATDTIIFWCLTSFLHMEPLVANVFSTAVGVSMSFFFNRRYTFKVHDKAGKRMIAFFTVGGFGLLVSESIIGYGVNLFPQLEPVFVKIVAVALVGAFQFVLNRNITFRTALDAQGDDDDIV